MKLGQETYNTNYKQNKCNKKVADQKKTKKIGDKFRHFVNLNSTSQENIPHHKHPTSQAFNTVNIPHPKYPISPAFHIASTPHFEHPTGSTFLIPNIIHLLTFHIPNRKKAVSLLFSWNLLQLTQVLWFISSNL